MTDPRRDDPDHTPDEREPGRHPALAGGAPHAGSDTGWVEPGDEEAGTSSDGSADSAGRVRSDSGRATEADTHGGETVAGSGDVHTLGGGPTRGGQDYTAVNTGGTSGDRHGRGLGDERAGDDEASAEE